MFKKIINKIFGTKFYEYEIIYLSSNNKITKLFIKLDYKIKDYNCIAENLENGFENKYSKIKLLCVLKYELIKTYREK